MRYVGNDIIIIYPSNAFLTLLYPARFHQNWKAALALLVLRVSIFLSMRIKLIKAFYNYQLFDIAETFAVQYSSCQNSICNANQDRIINTTFLYNFIIK